jgi:hypothetical protein
MPLEPVRPDVTRNCILGAPINDWHVASGIFGLNRSGIPSDFQKVAD